MIGDLSLKDCEVLVMLAKNHKRILEGGCGGSTQILTHYSHGSVVSYDTEPAWIEKTIGNFKKLGIKGQCEFRTLDPAIKLTGTYGLVFVDTAREFRLPFAMRAWNLLERGGQMAFHDTRRERDQANVLALVGRHYKNVLTVECNYLDSNITIITKRHKRAEYRDWNKEERRTKAQIGIE